MNGIRHDENLHKGVHCAFTQNKINAGIKLSWMVNGNKVLGLAQAFYWFNHIFKWMVDISKNSFWVFDSMNEIVANFREFVFGFR